MESKRLKTFLLSLLLFSSALFFYASALGDKPFFTRGEGREALVVRAMEDQDNLILPRRNGALIPSKPPLFHWLGYAAASLGCGISEFAIRFPSALCAALGLMFFFLFAAAGTSLANAGLAAAILASTFEWNRSATAARVDMCFSLFLSLSVYCLFHFFCRWPQESKPNWKWWPAVVLVTALSVMAKGPAGLLIPWAIAGVYLFIASGCSFIFCFKSFPYLSSLLAVAAAALGAGIWYFLAYQQGGQEFLDVQLLRENLARVVEMPGEEVGHQQLFFFSIIHLFLGFLPWSLLFPMLCAWLWHKRWELTRDKMLLYSAVWLAMFILIVSISVSKRTVYLLPAYPAAAYLLAICLNEVFANALFWLKWLKFERSLWRLLSSICFVALLLLSLAWMLGPKLDYLAKYFRPKTAEDILLFLGIFQKHFSVILVVFAVFCFFSSAARAISKNDLLRFVSYSAAGVLLIIFGSNNIVLSDYAQAMSPLGFMEQVKQRVPPDAPLLQYKHGFYTPVYYSGRNVPFVGDVKALFERSGEKFLLVQESEVKEIQQAIPSAEILLRSSNRAANGQDVLLLLAIESRAASE